MEGDDGGKLSWRARLPVLIERVVHVTDASIITPFDTRTSPKFARLYSLRQHKDMSVSSASTAREKYSSSLSLNASVGTVKVCTGDAKKCQFQ